MSEDSGAKAGRSLFRNAKSLIFGVIGAKIAIIGTTPILSRLYSPESYGELAVFVAITTVLSPLLSLMFPTTIPLARTFADRILNVVVSLTASIWMFVFLALGWAIFFFLFPGIANNSYGHLMPLALLGSIFMAFYEILTNFLIKSDRYRLISFSQALQAFLNSGLKVLFAFVPALSNGLILAQVFNGFYGILLGWRRLLLGIRAAWRRGILTPHNIKSRVRFYRDYPIFRLPSQLLMLAAAQLPVFFFGLYYEKGVVGQLSMAMTIMTMPMTLIANPVSQAYFGQIAKIGENEIKKLESLTRALVFRMTLMSLPPVIVLYFFADKIIPLLLGQQWKIAGVFVSIFSCYLLTQFVASPIIKLFNVVGGQRVYLFINAVRFVVAIALLYVLGSAGEDYLVTAKYYAFFMAAFYFFVIVVAFWVLGRGRDSV